MSPLYLILTYCGHLATSNRGGINTDTYYTCIKKINSCVEIEVKKPHTNHAISVDKCIIKDVNE